MKKKKRKRQFEMLQESMKNMVQVVEAQKASDKIFMELKEKRMRMEEAQQEREMQMRREEWEFQLQMFYILAAPLYQSGTPSYASQPSMGFPQ